MTLLTIQDGGYESVPPGLYKAKFVALEETETAKGKAYRWRFEVTEGTQSGKAISELSDRESPPTVKNKTGRFLCALAKQAVASGVAIDPDAHVGKHYMCFVEAKDGGSKLVTFTAA